MPDTSRPAESIPVVHPDLPPPAGLDRTAAETAPEPESPSVAHPVGWGFISLYGLAYIGTVLLFLAPLLVSLR